MALQILVLTVEHDDVGMTIRTTIKLGDAVLADYMPGTRWEDMAQEVANDVIAAALKPLFDQAVIVAGCRPGYSPHVDEERTE